MSFIKSRVYGALLMGAALVFGLPQAGATEIKFALEMYEGDNPEYNAAKAFKDYVENKSNGELTVRLDVRALERLVQIESHGTIDGLGTLPDLTLEEAIRAADAGINFIKEVGRDHYKKMTKVCS